MICSVFNSCLSNRLRVTLGYAAAAAFMSALSACDSGSTAPAVLTGVFVDGDVEGLDYTTQTLTGVTNARGEFQYVDGESITFSIGELPFPTVAAGDFLTPFQLSSGSTNPLATTLNIARLLQSLDEDGDASNGIRIPEQAASSATAVDFDVSPSAFEQHPAVINLVANSGSVTTTLIINDSSRR